MSEYEAEWHRLSGWTWVTGAISTIGKAIVPALVGGVSAGFANVFMGLAIVVAAAALAGLVGLIPWLTTTYRVTGTHLEVRRGLLNRTRLTARIDRVRSVDLQSTLVHRIVGVTKVSIGTGVDESQISLDSLTKEAAAELRRVLIHGTRIDDAGLVAQPHDAVDRAAADGEIIAKLNWSWIRYAPLNLKNLAIALGGMAALAGFFADALPWDRIWMELAPNQIESVPLDKVVRVALIAAAVALVAALVVWVVGSCVGYAVRWWGLQVVREGGRDGTVLRRSHGLTSTRVTTVEEAKVRGASSSSGPLIRLAGGADLTLLTTGLDDNNPAVLPTAPDNIVNALSGNILGEDALSAPLTAHGSRVRRRYWFHTLRGVVGVAFLSLGATVAIWHLTGLWLGWIPLAASMIVLAIGLPSAELRYRHLGHALTDRYVVARTGSYSTVTTALETDGIVGWRFTQGPFDRRLGLAQLTAMTAAGREQVDIPDIPLDAAVALTAAATPRPVSEFLC
jgi:putative membrane protein